MHPALGIRREVNEVQNFGRVELQKRQTRPNHVEACHHTPDEDLLNFVAPPQECGDLLVQIPGNYVELKDAATSQIVHKHDDLVTLFQIADVSILALALTITKLDTLVDHYLGKLLGRSKRNLSASGLAVDPQADLCNRRVGESIVALSARNCDTVQRHTDAHEVVDDVTTLMEDTVNVFPGLSKTAANLVDKDGPCDATTTGDALVTLNGTVITHHQHAAVNAVVQLGLFGRHSKIQTIASVILHDQNTSLSPERRRERDR